MKVPATASLKKLVPKVFVTTCSNKVNMYRRKGEGEGRRKEKGRKEEEMRNEEELSSRGGNSFFLALFFF